MTRRLRWCLALLLTAACARIPVTEELTIEPDEGGDTVVVTASTKLMTDPPNEHLRARAEAARAAALSGSDPWSIRFARLSTPEQERVTYQKSRGTLEQVVRSARIPSDDLQHLLADTNITVNVVRGEGWREIAFYPGSGGRATREQQREFDATLGTWSESVARYFTAVHHLYAYLRQAPGRDVYVFQALMADNVDEALVTEEEAPLIAAVVDAMGAIATQMDEHEGRAATLAEEADLVFNPFPARMVVRVPGDVLSSKGFGKELTIEPVDLFAAIGKLEGRWISPDPLAALLRDEQPTAERLAEAPRKSEAVVSSAEIARAIREQLARPREYSVRWRE
ncbi:MAG TPA: hypothetical protein VF432_28165 [Thermoanaerobaculia bacterium]